MSNLSSHLTKALASAVVTAAALSGNVMAATCAGAKCGPKTTATKSKCGACGAKPVACSASGVKHKTKAKAKAKCGAKCGAAKPKCSAKCGAATKQ